VDRQRLEDHGEAELGPRLLQLVQQRQPESVEALARMAQEEFWVSEDAVLDVIVTLERAGKITLTSPGRAGGGGLRAYLRGGAGWYWRTLGFVLLTSVVVTWLPATWWPWLYLRYVVGTVFAVWVPGYSLVKALFPAGDTGTGAGVAERFALGFGLSLALVALVGLLLNYSPWGVRLVPVVVSLDVLTVVLATVGVMRESRAG
jgi:hypothetical protein